MENKTKKASQNQLRRICCILIKEVTDQLTSDQADTIISQESIITEQIKGMLGKITASMNVSINTDTVVDKEKSLNDLKIELNKKLIIEEFDKFETAFPQALEIAMARNSIQVKVHLEDLAKVLNCSHPTIGRIFRFRDAWKYIPGTIRFNLIKSLSQDFPQRWPRLRSSQSSLAKHFKP